MNKKEQQFKLGQTVWAWTEGKDKLVKSYLERIVEETFVTDKGSAIDKPVCPDSSVRDDLACLYEKKTTTYYLHGLTFGFQKNKIFESKKDAIEDKYDVVVVDKFTKKK